LEPAQNLATPPNLTMSRKKHKCPSSHIELYVCQACTTGVPTFPRVKATHEASRSKRPIFWWEYTV
jgi:hypothetical protein